MEGIHSYEQRSSSESEIGLELGLKRNRVILVNRRAPDVAWSTSNRSAGANSDSSESALSWLCRLSRRLLNSRIGRRQGRAGQRGPGSKVRIRSKSHEQWTAKHDSGPFVSNEWRTSKYTVLNFLPKNLFEQFRRFANFYFLTGAVLQLVLPFSPVGPATSLLPLIFVVSTTAVKQAYEDYLRHKLDRLVNSRRCRVLRNKRLERVHSKDIRVGDFVQVRNNEEIPCDMILLAVAHEADRCYATTANLDGETSLKPRSCFQIRDHLGSIEDLDDTLLVLECERPSATLYEFNGHLRAPKSAAVYQQLVGDLVDGQRSPSCVGRTRSVSSGGSAATSGLSGSSAVQTILSRLRHRSMTTSLAHQQQQHHEHSDTLAKHTSTQVSSDLHEIPLDLSNLLLRASRLRNTAFVYGLAVYTGSDTKLAQNSLVKPNKFSTTESRVNMFLIVAFLLLIAFSLASALIYHQKDQLRVADGRPGRQFNSFWEILVAHILLYNYLIPISLYVTLEFVKFYGTSSVLKDKQMTVQVIRTLHATSDESLGAESGSSTLERRQPQRQLVSEGPKCNSSDLNEELGQVEVLFSDKTGTLTENRMLFVACSAYGALFRRLEENLYEQPGELFGAPIARVAAKIAQLSANRYAYLAQPVAADNEHTPGERAHPQEDDQHPQAEHQQQPRRQKSPRPRAFDHRHPPALRRLRPVGDLERHEQLVDFFVCLCLCSTVTLNESTPLADCLPDRLPADGFNFQAASPDEESLITAAHQFGISMCKSTAGESFIAIERGRASSPAKQRHPTADERRHPRAPSPSKGNYRALVEGSKSTPNYIVRHFKRLLVFEFTSARKRMSVVYRDCDNDCLIMATKGSEELLDCVDLQHLTGEQELQVDLTLAHFEAFARSGLRTMLVCERQLEPDELELIQTDLRDARLSVSQRRDGQVAEVQRRAECGLRLIGATALEDTLQEGVPETIANLRLAGIKVWLLTGDKVETAISVAFLCRLLDSQMRLLHLVRQQDVQSCQRLLSVYNQQLQTEHSDGIGRLALVADGRSLHYAMKYARDSLASLCKRCTCVLGCRLSPLQKAEVVAMVKSSPERPITAAIGDGANDVSMIQEAHVGIGISGKEGKQAVNSSDFAISRFRMLNRLLFVHGHLFYHRTANLVHYFFYKNLLFMLPQFLYSFYNQSSAKSLYHPILLIGFNLFFTSVPILLYGLHEVNIPEQLLEEEPKLYQLNRSSAQMHLGVFLSWLSLAAVQGLLGFYHLRFIWANNQPFGRSVGSQTHSAKDTFAIIIYFVTILTVTCKLYTLARSQTCLLQLLAWTSVILLPVMLIVCTQFDISHWFSDTSLSDQPLLDYFRSPYFWLAIVSSALATCLPDIIWYLRCRHVYLRQVGAAIEHTGENSGGHRHRTATRRLRS